METHFSDTEPVQRQTCLVPNAGNNLESEPVSISYINAHPTTTKQGKGLILLIHGFPETSYQFRKVIPLLTQAGYRVMAPDYRGAGDSSKPTDPKAYLKSSKASDLHYIIQKELDITAPVHVVGHDMGGMVAHAYATLFPADTASVTWGECPLPGTKFYEDIKEISKSWHQPEDFAPGKEHAYIKRFFDELTYNRAAITSSDVDFYVKAYSAPGAMRAGHNTYLMFEEDAKENTARRKRDGKSKVRCLTLNGAESFASTRVPESAEEFYEKVEAVTVANSNHWIAEENPDDFAKAVLDFIGQN